MQKWTSAIILCWWMMCLCCVSVLSAINDDSSAVPGLLTDYILKGELFCLSVKHSMSITSKHTLSEEWRDSSVNSYRGIMISFLGHMPYPYLWCAVTWSFLFINLGRESLELMTYNIKGNAVVLLVLLYKLSSSSATRQISENSMSRSLISA